MGLQLKGSRAQLRAYYEASYGQTPAARNGVRLPAVDIGIGLTQGLVTSRVLQGNRSETMPVADQRTVAGSTTVQPDVRSFGWLARHLLGSYSVVQTGPITSLNITAAGTGYTTPPTVAFAGGGGSGAAATAIVAGGLVTGFIFTNNGTGYTSAPTVTLTGGGGTGATATANVAYTHTFKVADLAASLMLEKYFSDGGFAYQYIGCKPNGLTWDVGTGGLQECSLDWVGQDEIYAAAPEDASPLLHPVVGFKLPSVTLAQAGISLTRATRFGLNLANNIEGTRTIGNAGIIADAPEGVIGVSGPLEVAFDSNVQYAKAKAGTEETLVVTYPAANGMSLQWLLDEVQYEVASPGVPGPAGLTVGINYHAYYDDGAAASAVRLLLVNDVPTYAAIP